MNANATLIAVAQALTESLAAAPLSMPAEIERTYVAKYDRSKETGCRIYVMPLDLDLEAATKVSDDLTCQIAIHVVSKINPETIIASVDALMLLVDDICTWLRGRDLATEPEAAWSETVNKPVFDAKRLRVSNTFVSVVTVTYVVQKLMRT